MSRFRPALQPNLSPVPTAATVAEPSRIGTADASPARLSAPPSMQMGKLGILLGIYLLSHTAPIVELIESYLHVNFYEVVLLGTIVTLGALFSGKIGRFLKLPVAKVWVALGVFYLLASVFGIYRRQSVVFMLEYLVRFHAMPFLICAIAVSLEHVRKLMLWAATASWLITLVCFVSGTYAEGRFHVPTTALENPNDLSFLLLISLGYGVLFFFSRSLAARVVTAVAFPGALYFVLRTGSRANFLTFLVAVAVAILIVPGRVKIALAAMSLMGALALAFSIPGSTWERLTMISSNPEEDLLLNPELSHELGSQIARVELQRRAYRLALEHPIFGVGPLMFADAADQLVRRESGRKSSWQNAHNVYLQIAAENGIPAILLYVSCLVMGWRMNYRAYRTALAIPKLAGARAQSFCLLLATAIFAFGIVFCNFIYDPLWPILLGLSAANYLALQEMIRRAPLSPAA